MEFFDTHSHYDDSQFDEDRQEVIKKIYNAGVTKCIDVGCNIETSKMAVELANQHNFMYAICGIHPSEISYMENGKNLEESKEKIDEQISQIRNLILQNKKVVAIGEIGLDYHYDDSPPQEIQKYAFIKQIEIANELNLPISVHTRDAIDDTIAIIKNNRIEYGGVLHCCPFNRELVKHGLEQGLHIAFGGTVTFRNAKNAPEIVQMVPDEKILIETDAPYLAPDPIRGTKNDSSNLKYVVQKLAELRKKTPEEIAKLTYTNAEKLFRV